MPRWPRTYLWRLGLIVILVLLIFTVVLGVSSRSTGVLILLATLAIIVSVLAVILLHRSYAADLRRLARDALRVGRGEPEHRIDPPAMREVRLLAETLNAFADQFALHTRRIDQQRREEEAILQAMTTAVIALDSQHRIINMNRSAERMLRATLPEARGRLIQELIREPQLHALIGQMLRNGPVTHVEDDGSEQPMLREFTLWSDPPMTVQAIAERMRTEGSRGDGLVLLLDDITRIKRLESLRSDFAANVSHELRTPITNLKGYVETLLEVGMENAEQADRFLNIIKHNCDRLAAIVDDVMALAELERPRTRDTLEREAVSIRAVAEEVARLFASQAATKQMHIEIDIAPTLRGNVHSGLIGQALGNLVSNAINYSPPSTTVRIHAQPLDARQLELCVTDQGPGIATEHQARLFERFYRADRARSRELGGTGLGLSIVKHIALVHRGQVEVDSQLEQGSTFRMILPRADA